MPLKAKFQVKKLSSSWHSSDFFSWLMMLAIIEKISLLFFIDVPVIMFLYHSCEHHGCRCHRKHDARVSRAAKRKSREIGKVQTSEWDFRGKYAYFWRHPNHPDIKCRIRRGKPSCRKPARCDEPFQNNTGSCDGETDATAIIPRYAYASCGKKNELWFVDKHVLYPIPLLHTTFIHQKW